MRTFKRAWLHVTRKKGKSLLSILCIALIMVLLFVGALIDAGAHAAVQQLNGDLRASFTMKFNPNIEGYDGTPTGDIIEKVADVEGIARYSPKIEMMGNIYLQDMKLLPGQWSKWYNEGKVTETYTEDYLRVAAQTPLVEGVRYSDLYRHFITGAMQLKAGRHIGPDDRHVVILSEDLARQNGLSLGDTVRIITTEANCMYYGVEGLPDTVPIQERMKRPLAPPMDVEIIGLFQSVAKDKGSADDPMYEDVMPENCIFVDQALGLELRALRRKFAAECFGFPVETTDSYEEVVFAVDDPAQLEAVIDRVKVEVPETERLRFEAGAGSYQAAVAPLQSLKSIVRIALIVVCTAGLALLLVLFILWSRHRRREVGVLLADGIRRRSILLQFLLEGCMLTLVAMVLALPVASGVTGAIGARALTDMKAQTNREELLQVPEEEMISFTKPYMQYADMAPEKLEMKLTPAIGLLVTGLTLAIVILAIVLANLRILLMKPSRILTRAQ